VQLDLLYDLPGIDFLKVNMILPCSEEEWNAETADKWSHMRKSPTPPFPQVFEEIFERPSMDFQKYSEFGGYVMISAILSAILQAHRNASAFNFGLFDGALDTWQRLWQIDPKSRFAGPSSQSGAMAFNASTVYRAASIRRFRDYSRYSTAQLTRIKFAVRLIEEEACSEEILRMLNEPFERTANMIRALVPACVSFQIPVKLGVKLVAQTAALFWSVDHVFCNFEVGK
jgi:hypothetical protein